MQHTITTVRRTSSDAMDYLDDELSLSATYDDGHSVNDFACTAPWGLDPAEILEQQEEFALELMNSVH